MADNVLANQLKGGDGFIITIEYTVPDVSEKTAFADVEALAKFAAEDDRVSCIALTDRVPTMRCYDPIDLAVVARDVSGKMPLIHMSGKNRDRFTLQSQIDRLVALGLQNCLLLTGDMPRVDLPDPMAAAPNGYVDSVQAIDMARKTSDELFIAAAVSSFKYLESTNVMQYNKVRRKIAHGANAIFNQVGYDMRKFHELPMFMKTAGLDTPVVAALYWLTLPFGRFANRNEVPGVVITDEMVNWLAEINKLEDKGKSIRQEVLALQIVLARAWGYRGVHIGGFKKSPSVKAILDLADQKWQEGDAERWWARWKELLRFSDGRPVEAGVKDGFYLFEADGSGLNSDRPAATSSQGAGVKYHVMHAVHNVFFDQAMQPGHWMNKISRLMGKAWVLERLYYALEEIGKKPLVGCEGCGSCSLPETLYVCTESACAKKLPNGPCGGPRLDGRCEVKPERDCAYVEVYRRAKATNQLEAIADNFVPAKDRSLRGTSSWVNMANGADHRALGKEPVKE